MLLADSRPIVKHAIDLLDPRSMQALESKFFSRAKNDYQEIDRTVTEQELFQESDQAKQNPTTRKRRFPWGMIVVAFIFVIVPFISWYGTWFGRPLSDEKMAEYLNDKEKPRNVQHALSQIATRIIENDSSVKRWYPAVISASEHSLPQIRLTAAWVMGQDNTQEEFHTVLLRLLKDEHPGVRHNAALSLVRFNDRSGRPELQAMLTPQTLRAEGDGAVEFFVEEGAPFAEGSPLIRIKQSDGREIEIRAKEEGRAASLKIEAGAIVNAGDELMTISPSAEQVWQTLRAFFIIGESEDIPYVQRYARPLPGMPDRIYKQALSTIEAIRARPASPSS